MTASRINYKALAEIHPELIGECYVFKEVPKDVFRKHVYSFFDILNLFIVYILDSRL